MPWRRRADGFAQHPRIVSRLKLAAARPQNQPGIDGASRSEDGVPLIVLADDSPGLAVREKFAEFRCAIHRIETDDDRPELPRGYGRDEKLRYILKDNRDAVATADATLPEPTRELVTEAIQLGIG